MGARVKKDEITPALAAVMKSLDNKRNIHLMANTVKAVITNRTLAGESLKGGSFKSYSKREYRAPIAGRAPGVPTPTGGRKTSKRTGRKLKAMVYEGGYGAYKSAMGFGGRPQLSLTNRMLNSIQVYVMSAKKAMLFFAGQLSNAKAHGLHYGKFPFFGITTAEQKNPAVVLINQLVKLKGVNRR